MNLDHLLNQSVDAPNATKMRPIPEADGVLALIDDIELDTISAKKGKSAGQEFPKLIIKWKILDESLKAAMEREELFIQQNFILDLDRLGNIDTGPDKNVRLGQLRDAVNLNGAGFTLGQLKGAGPALIKITQRPKSEQEPDIIYNDVSRVTKMN
jgi:hypothetical protein